MHLYLPTYRCKTTENNKIVFSMMMMIICCMSTKTTPYPWSELLEKNKQLVSNFVNDVLNRHDISAADNYFAQDPKPFKEFLHGFFQTFTDSHTIIEHFLQKMTRYLS